MHKLFPLLFHFIFHINLHINILELCLFFHSSIHFFLILLKNQCSRNHFSQFFSCYFYYIFSYLFIIHFFISFYTFLCILLCILKNRRSHSKMKMNFAYMYWLSSRCSHEGWRIAFCQKCKRARLPWCEGNIDGVRHCKKRCSFSFFF